jgi:hypothetical protein
MLDKEKETIRYQYKVLPTHIYKEWLQGYIKNLPEKEVKRLSSSMPELSLTDFLIHENVGL